MLSIRIELFIFHMTYIIRLFLHYALQTHLLIYCDTAAFHTLTVLVFFEFVIIPADNVSLTRLAHRVVTPQLT